MNNLTPVFCLFVMCGIFFYITFSITTTYLVDRATNKPIYSYYLIKLLESWF